MPPTIAAGTSRDLEGDCVLFAWRVRSERMICRLPGRSKNLPLRAFPCDYGFCTELWQIAIEQFQWPLIGDELRWLDSGRQQQRGAARKSYGTGC